MTADATVPAETRRTGLIVAIDTPDAARARALAEACAAACGMIKLGLEFFAARGPEAIRAPPMPVFLDLKLHDIPNTVAGAVRALAPTGARMLTVHAGGGPAMLAAARDAAETWPEDGGTPRPVLLAVTVLTSFDTAMLAGTGVLGGIHQQTLRLTRLALDAGADGIVCGGGDVAAVRDAFGGGPVIVVPGVRLPGDPPADQARIVTPAEAAAAGADWIVVGRSITRAADPAAAAASVAAMLA